MTNSYKKLTEILFHILQYPKKILEHFQYLY